MYLCKDGAGDRWSHEELTIHWTPQKKQWVLALVDTEVEYTLISGNIHKCMGYVTVVDSYGDSFLKVKQVLLCMQIGQLPPRSY